MAADFLQQKMDDVTQALGQVHRLQDRLTLLRPGQDHTGHQVGHLLGIHELVQMAQDMLRRNPAVWPLERPPVPSHPQPTAMGGSAGLGMACSGRFPPVPPGRCPAGSGARCHPRDPPTPGSAPARRPSAGTRAWHRVSALPRRTSGSSLARPRASGGSAAQKCRAAAAPAETASHAAASSPGLHLATSWRQFRAQ